MVFVRQRLADLAGPVLDLGCVPGHWTSHVQSLRADVSRVVATSRRLALLPETCITEPVAQVPALRRARREARP